MMTMAMAPAVAMATPAKTVVGHTNKLLMSTLHMQYAYMHGSIGISIERRPHRVDWQANEWTEERPNGRTSENFETTPTADFNVNGMQSSFVITLNSNNGAGRGNLFNVDDGPRRRRRQREYILFSPIQMT